MWSSRGNDSVVRENADIGKICFNQTITHTVGLWKVENALLSTLPIFIVQLALITSISYLLKHLLAPFHQPRIVANIIGGVILSLIGSTTVAQGYIFELKAAVTLETMANLGLIYYMFILGLQADFKSVLHARSKVFTIGAVGILVPITLGYALHRFLTRDEATTQLQATMHGPLVWGLTLANTNFPEVTEILADVKLLHSEIGRTALSISVISDLTTWIINLIMRATFTDDKIYRMLSIFALVIMFVFVLRPALSWMVRHADNFYESYDDMDHQICLVMAGVLLLGFICDACGASSTFGAFMLGAIMPKGELKNAIIEKVEYYTSIVLMPLFFSIIGNRTQAQSIIIDNRDILLLFPIIVLGFLAKPVVTFVAAIINKMPLRDSLALGLIMNTKGVLALKILQSGRNSKVLNDYTFTVMMIVLLVMTVAVGPLVTLINKPNGSSKQSKHRSIRSIPPNSEFRILTCIHSLSNVSGIINILEATNPTKKSPLSVFLVHLVERSGQASAMFIVHDKCSTNKITSTDVGRSVKNQKHSRQLSTSTNNIVAAFENFEIESEEDSVSLEAITSVSSYPSMHEDIRILAEDKCVDLIIVPFHKQSTIGGGMDNENPGVRGVNKNILEKASCSVAIFMDRWLKDSSYSKNGGGHNCRHCAMLFIGGPDDREALAFAWRLSSNHNPNISLTVVRFIVGKDAAVDLNLLTKNHDHNEDENENILRVTEEKEKEKQLDDQYVESFMLNTRNQPSMKLIDEVVNNGEEILKRMSAMESDYDLYIVGGGQRVSSPLTIGLSELGDYPELGPLGDTLVSSNFVSSASVLIVHRGATSVDELDAQHH